LTNFEDLEKKKTELQKLRNLSGEKSSQEKEKSQKKQGYSSIFTKKVINEDLKQKLREIEAEEQKKKLYKKRIDYSK
jgi:hypothetical protein